jgi:hypothetical protein
MLYIKDFSRVSSTMKISYAITVCNEARDLYSLLNFLKTVKDPEDEINILLDSAHTTESVRNVLKLFSDTIVVNERDFDGDFAEHRNFHLKKCSGEYIFIVDPDEMPKEKLIKSIKSVIEESGADLITVPRINLHPGCTQEWLDKYKFKTNELDWINWPDYICRVFKNDPDVIKYGNKLHENIVGATKVISLKSDPSIAVWHIKSIDKQDCRWDSDGNFDFKVPDGENFYDTLM